jgi:hypothetical protein
MAIIGFSLPSHDEYAIQAIYAMARNFQHYDAGDLIRKTRLRLVDWCRCDGERHKLRERYRFVDWALTDLDEKGFRPEAVPFIFAQDDSSASTFLDKTPT